MVSPLPGEEGVGGILYVVSTPIGNMGDFSFRAVDVLRSVSVVLAEDTRHSRPLLDRYEVPTPVQAYHEHNEARTTPAIVARLLAGESIALVSDAGTPIVSDPGERLVRAAIEAGVRVCPVPGASAVLAALVASGIAAEPFTFYGFLPRKGRERDDVLSDIVESRHTAVLYESPHRVGATLAGLVRAGGGTRAVAVARELTKMFEEVRRGTLEALAAYYEETTVKGEVVIVVEGRAEVALDETMLREQASELRERGLSARDVVAALTEQGAPRNLAYRLAHGDLK